MELNNTTTGGSEDLGYMEHYENSLLLQVVILGIFSVIGVAGNVVILVTGFRRRMNGRGASEFRSRQDYKPAFITNLAIADILVLVYGVPFHLIQEKMVPVSEFVCRFLVPLRDVLALTSILTIMAISVERAIAIISPFALETAHQHTRCGIVCIWITAYLLAGLPMVFVMTSTENNQCYPKWKERKLEQVHQTSAALLIIVPGLVTTSCYMFCLRALHRFRERRQSSGGDSSTGVEQWTFVQQTRTVSRIALVLVGIFWLCNLPLVTFAICLHYHLISPGVNVQHYVRAILFCLFFGASVVNPIVLIAMSPLYRRSASGFLRYLFAKMNAIVRYSRLRRRPSYSSEATNRMEQSSGVNEFALASRQESILST